MFAPRTRTPGVEAHVNYIGGYCWPRMVAVAFMLFTTGRMS
jgi:hypothetical protein